MLQAKGYSQQPGIDFQEIFSLVARNEIRILLALSVELDLAFYHLDVVMVYVNGELEEGIFTESIWILTSERRQMCLHQEKRRCYLNYRGLCG